MQWCFHHFVPFNPTNLYLFISQDPEILPGRLQTTVGHLNPMSIWNKLAPTESTNQKQVAGSDQSSVPMETKPSPLIHTCPHMVNSSRETGDSGDEDFDVSSLVMRCRTDAEAVMRELSLEADRLGALSSKDFWELYFAKLPNPKVHKINES